MTPLTLADWLGRLYAERHGLGQQGAANAFKAALAEEPALKAAAVAELGRLDGLAGSVGELSRRCVISATYRDALARALKVES